MSIISINDFKKNKTSEEDLTKAGISFRMRFSEALSDLEVKYQKEINEASISSQVKTKINISNIVKQAKSSPLAAYSSLHKEWVENEVKKVHARCEELFNKKFPNSNKITIESLQKKIIEERKQHKEEISKLASQKMTEYLQLKEK